MRHGDDRRLNQAAVEHFLRRGEYGQSLAELLPCPAETVGVDVRDGGDLNLRVFALHDIFQMA